MVCDAGPAGVSESAFAGGADPWAAAVVLVVGGDVPDPGVQPDGVVLVADDGELGPEDGGVADAVEVRPVGLDVGEQALDPGLVGGCSGSSASSASRNTTCTCVEVSSIETSSVIHLRVTRSITANTAIFGQPAKCVTS